MKDIREAKWGVLSTNGRYDKDLKCMVYPIRAYETLRQAYSVMLEDVSNNKVIKIADITDFEIKEK